MRIKLPALILALTALMVACTGEVTLPAAEQEAEPQAEDQPTATPTEAPQEADDTSSDDTITAGETPSTDEGANGEPALPPPPTDDAPAVLPASLYFIREEDGQVYRLEPNAADRVQVTFEPVPVDEFAVSASGERVAYVADNTLYLVDLYGAGRTAIVERDPEAEDFFLRLRDLSWSSDGTRLAYHDEGLAIYDVASQTSELVLPSDPVPDLDGDAQTETPDPDEPAVSIAPLAWGPTGERILIQQAIYFSDGTEIAVYTLAEDTITRLSSPDGLVCCNPTWTPEGEAIITSSDSAGFLIPGMWRIDAETGEGTTLIYGAPTGDEEVYTLVFGARELGDGFIYRFQTTVEGFPQEQPLMQMVRSLPDEDPTTLQEQGYIPGEVVWDPAGSGAVILDLTEQYTLQGFPDFPYRGDLLWLPADGDPVPLGVRGGDPAWGD